MKRVEYEFTSTYSLGRENVKPDWDIVISMSKYRAIKATDITRVAKSIMAGTMAWSINLVNILENIGRIKVILVLLWAKRQ